MGIFISIFSLAKQILVSTLLKVGVNAVNWTELAQVESNAGCCDYSNIPFAYTEEFPDQWGNCKTST
jgi:hypothetical protein